jgi:hypothetical protein
MKSKQLSFVKNLSVATIVVALASACQSSPFAPRPTPTVITPNLTAVPAELRAGEPITLIGDDWQASEEIAFTLVPNGTNPTGSIVLGLTKADANGRFQFSGVVPAQAAAGTYDVLAQSNIPGRPFARSPITIRAALSAIASVTPLPPPTSSPAPTNAPNAPTQAPVVPAPPRATPTPIVLVTLPAQPTAAPQATQQTFNDWRADYYPNTSLQGEPAVTRNEPVLDFDWRTGSPDARIPFDNFSARWQRRLYFDGGTYRFTLRVDDGARLYVDNVLVLDAFQDGGVRTLATDLTLGRGDHTLRIDYYERSGVAIAQLSFAQLSGALPTPIPNVNTATPIPLPTAPPPPTPAPTATRVPASATPIPLNTQPPIVATTTPIPLATLTPTRPPVSASATPIPLATETVRPTITTVPPTATRAPATATAIPLATETVRPTNTAVPATATTAPATETPIPLATETVRPTNTAVPATATTAPATSTSIPLATETVRPTDTAVPPTATTAPVTETPIPLATDTPVPAATNTTQPIASETPRPSSTPRPTATARPTRTPTPTRNPNQGPTVSSVYSNGEVRISGEGWLPRERVTVFLSANADGSNAVRVDRKNADRNGRFRTDRIAPPFGNPGDTIYAVVEQGGLRVIVPVPLSTAVSTQTPAP